MAAPGRSVERELRRRVHLAFDALNILVWLGVLGIALRLASNL